MDCTCLIVDGRSLVGGVLEAIDHVNASRS